MAWRQWVKVPLRPVVRPVLAKLEARLGQRTVERLDSAERALAALASELGRVQQSVQDLVGSVAVAPDGSFRDPFEEVFRRIEFVRREVLFELRYGNRQESQELDAEPRIVNTAKLEQMKPDIRLNLGAGHVRRAGYLNVDARELQDIDVVADIRRLPFEEGSLAEIYSAHVLEHFPVEELRLVVLPYWTSLLRPGGEFVAVVPDMETMTHEYVAGRMTFDELREVTYGTQEYEGDTHFNGFSQESLRALLEGAGLTDVSFRAWARRNGMCYEMEIVGVRPGAPSPG